MSDILKLSVRQLSEQLSMKKLSSEEITRAYLASIEAQEAQIGAYLTVLSDRAIAQAQAIDAARAKGEALGALAGIPYALKDNLCTNGIRTTCASRMLEDFVPPYSAFAAERLEAERGVLLGKLNMDEFAMGSSTESSYFHPTRNPVALDRVPGGSSGGSAAAVAANEAPYTLGSDTGGSIRQPASFCGVVGMKPTYGRVSRFGLVAFASSLDQIGPLTKNVEDNAIILSAIAGQDGRDATSLPDSAGDFTARLRDGVKGLRIGIAKEFFSEGIQAEVKDAVLAAARRLCGMGATQVEVSLPSLPHALSAYYLISSAEASSNLARFDGIRYGHRAKEYDGIDELYKRSRDEGFGAEVKRRILLGTFALSSGYYDAYYKKAQQVRSLIRAEFDAVYQQCDVLLAPVAPTTAYKLGEKSSNPLEMYLGDIYSVPINIAGLPALALPCGKDKAGLPIGVQLIGPQMSECELYRVGYALEGGN